MRYKHAIKRPSLPDQTDLEQWVMHYQEISFILHRKPDGYSVTFVWNHRVHSTPSVLTSQAALEAAKEMVEMYKAC